MYIEVLRAIASDLNPWWREPSRRPGEHFLPARRDRFELLVERCLAPDRATSLIGPRQVGKSTLLIQVAAQLLEKGLPGPNITYFDFWDSRLGEAVSPQALVDLVPDGFVDAAPRVFLFDEVHRAERWDRWLKQAVDRQRTVPEALRHRFVVTGSSASLLGKGGRESGFGRWTEVTLEGLSLGEFQRITRGGPESFERFLRLGGFPAYARSEETGPARREIREQVAEGAIYKDLLGRNLDLSRVRALFAYLVSSSGGIWNAVKRAEDLQTDRRTLGVWLEALEASRLIVTLPKYVLPGGKAAHVLRPHPKIYAVDHALVVAFSPLPDPLGDPETQAIVYETAVFAALRAYLRGTLGLSYYRDKNDVELDFLIEGEKGLIGIEVTSARQLRSDKIESARRAADAAGAKRLVLIHGGLRAVGVAGIVDVPLHEFLLEPRRWIEGGGT
jgi:hypothetical protein